MKKAYAEGKCRVPRSSFVPTPEPQVEPSWGFWFAGLVDGEGCFSFAARPDRSGLVVYIRPRFNVALRFDDLAAIEEIKKKLGFGNVWGYTGTSKKGTTRMAQFAVQSVSGCLALVDFFRKYPLRTKKGRDFDVWSEMVAAAAAQPGFRYEQAKEYLDRMDAIKRPGVQKKRARKAGVRMVVIAS